MGVTRIFPRRGRIFCQKKNFIILFLRTKGKEFPLLIRNTREFLRRKRLILDFLRTDGKKENFGILTH